MLIISVVCMILGKIITNFLFFVNILSFHFIDSCLLSVSGLAHSSEYPLHFYFKVIFVICFGSFVNMQI